MNKIRLVYGGVLAGFASILALVTAAMLAGCDTEPVQDFTVSVSPQTVEIQKDQSVEFVASGATRYSWSINVSSDTETNNPWGILSATTGDRVTYTSLREVDSSLDFVLRQLTVTGTLGTESVSNASARKVSATALIYHIP